MARQLAFSTYVLDEHGTVTWFHPGDTVPRWAAEQIDGPDAWADGATDDEDGDDEDYSSWKVDDLRAEIDRRNADRDEDDRIPDEGKKADLVAALELDDEQG